MNCLVIGRINGLYKDLNSLSHEIMGEKKILTSTLLIEVCLVFDMCHCPTLLLLVPVFCIGGELSV
jgi:hypothetical protein